MKIRTQASTTPRKTQPNICKHCGKTIKADGTAKVLFAMAGTIIPIALLTLAEIDKTVPIVFILIIVWVSRLHTSISICCLSKPWDDTPLQETKKFRKNFSEPLDKLPAFAYNVSII